MKKVESFVDVGHYYRENLIETNPQKNHIQVEWK